jgi:hypothetical protein
MRANQRRAALVVDTRVPSLEEMGIYARVPSLEEVGI